ncbi:hypothetical protein NMY22_g4543 [Coprinellus aureogranulatus]|nr:hypothetical protein NMY22_g4543 [Coprinellus aureogranulatus]
MPARDDTFLFPPPSRDFVTHLLAPRFWPGRSAETGRAVSRILKDNRQKWDALFQRMFHNHIVHTILAQWSMGANERILQAAYERPQDHLEPAPAPALEITKDNWADHLGDPKAYTAYLLFFENEVTKKGISQVLTDYVFSPAANLGTGKGPAPEMISRFLDGVFHPMIHLGCGVEFNMPGIVAEGLGQTAIHKASSSTTIPLSVFEEESPQSSNASLHSFTILARIIKDPELFNDQEDVMAGFGLVAGQFGRKIKALVDEWDVSNIDDAVEQLSWLVTMLYGVAGRESDAKYTADFFFMHFVTSAIFLPTLMAHIEKEEYKRILLRAYLNTVLVWYVIRHRPPLNFKAFFSDASTLQPTAPGPHPTPCLKSAKGVLEVDAITPNSWLQIIQSTLAHPDEHTPKLQRALVHFGEVYGDTAEKGKFKDTELDGAEYIDGTLFLRTAGLTMTRNKWVREGEEIAEGPDFRPVGVWDFGGFGRK